jgi:autotransporter-associated beta strand protein
LTVALDTIVGTTADDMDIAGPMAHFDPTRSYSWLAAQWAGTYSGPTDAATLDAATAFDTGGFLNPIAGTFGWSLDPTDKSLSLTYAPSAVPEPGTLALLSLTGGLFCFARRRCRNASRNCLAAVLSLAVACLAPACAVAQNGSWITNATGTYNWSDAGNWQNGFVADGAGNTADFATASLTGPVTVNLDSPRMIGSLVFDNPTNTYGWTVSGTSPLTLSSSSAVGGPSIAVNKPQVTATLSLPLAGTQGLTATGPGTLTLVGTNSYSGGTNVLNGTVQVASDASLGTGNVTGAALGTVNFTGTTTTTKSFAMNGGTVAVAAGKTLTFNGSVVSSAFLDGAGTFATDPTNGARFVNVTATPSVAITSNTAADQFVHFTNSGALNVAEGVGSSPFGSVPNGVTFNGFTNQGLGSITIDARVSPAPAQTGAVVNVSNFQTYGTLTVGPAVGSGQSTFLTNVGTVPLGFNSGSRTFVGGFDEGVPMPEYLGGINLLGKNAVLSGGLLVVNMTGFVVDYNPATDTIGTSTVIADYGSLVKGSGYFQNPVITQNGGRMQAGNSPGSASFGRFVFGPGGVSNYVFDINDATGTAGANSNANGWGLVKAVRTSLPPAIDGGLNVSSGDFTWTATPTNRLTVALDTIVGTTADDTDVAGPMADFDPTRAYSWLAAQWAGTYSGPIDAATLDAATSFDTSGFLNPVAGMFGWQLDQAGHALSLVYTPNAVPEPSSLLLLAAAAGGIANFARRRSRRKTARVGLVARRV